MGHRIAFVDIGSNTLKYSVTDIDDAGHETVVATAADTIRLGRGVARTGHIEAIRIDQAVQALRRFEAHARAWNAEALRGVATAALRMAANGEDLLRRIEAETAWHVRVISGDEEARLTYLGLRDGLPRRGVSMIADIGGASTELIRAEEGQPLAARSIEIGSGTLADRCFVDDPPGLAPVTAAKDVARQTFDGVEVLGQAAGCHLILPGGNGLFLSSLTAWDRLRLPFVPEFLPILLARLSEIPARDVAGFLGIAEERARMLPAGGAIALALVELVRPVSLHAVPSGIRGGIVREWVESGFAPDPHIATPTDA